MAILELEANYGTAAEFDQRTAAAGGRGADVAPLLQQYPPGKGDHHRNPAPSDEGADQRQKAACVRTVGAIIKDRGGSHCGAAPVGIYTTVIPTFIPSTIPTFTAPFTASFTASFLPSFLPSLLPSFLP